MSTIHPIHLEARAEIASGIPGLTEQKQIWVEDAILEISARVAELMEEAHWYHFTDEETQAYIKMTIHAQNSAKNGHGVMTPEERKELDTLIENAHKKLIH